MNDAERVIVYYAAVIAVGCVGALAILAVLWVLGAEGLR